MTVKKDLIKGETSRYISPFEEMERWFEDTWRRPFSLLRWPEMKVAEGFELSPSVDIFDKDNEMILKADLPGVKKEDLDVNLTEHVLTISGQKKREEKVERDDYYRYERSHGSFCRRFQIPDGVDESKIKAHFEGGVLEVRLPKTEDKKKKTKKISVE